VNINGDAALTAPSLKLPQSLEDARRYARGGVRNVPTITAVVLTEEDTATGNDADHRGNNNAGR